VRTRYVATEDELDVAYDALRELGGGIIYLTADIALTEDKCWDLTDITIFGSPIGHYYNLPPTRLDFNGYQIELIGAGCHFQDVVLNGTLTTPVGNGHQTLFTAATYGCGSESSSSSGDPDYDARTYQFIRCQFRNCIGGLSTGSVIDLSGLNDGVGFDKYVTLRFEMCTLHTDSMYPGAPLYGLVVYLGATDNTLDANKIRAAYMFVKDAEEGVWAKRNAFALRKDDSNNNTWIWHDDTVQVVEAATNVGRVSAVGNQPYRTRTGGFTIANDEIGMLNIMTGDGARTVNVGADAVNHNVSPGAYEDLVRLGTGDITFDPHTLPAHKCGHG
jgi:hypothetical protein